MKNKYLEVIEPDYTFYRVIPNTGIRNFNSYKIAGAINSCYISLLERCHIEDKKLTYKKPAKVSYLIVCEKEGISFYFIVPSYRKSLFADKISNTWKNVTIQTVTSLPEFSSEAIRYQMTYSKEDALSLDTNRVDNELLSATVNVVDVLGDKDRVGILYNFIPSGDMYQKGFRNNALETLKKFKENKPLDRDKVNKKYIGLVLLRGLIGFMDVLQDSINSFLGGAHKEANLADSFYSLFSQKQLSDATETKAISEVVKTQIMVISESDKKSTAESNALSVAGSYKVISKDNSLTPKKVIGIKKKLTDYNQGSDINNMSHNEIGANLIALPGKSLIEQHHIEAINVTENIVPEDLREGYIDIGINTHRGNLTQAYMSSDKNLANLGLTVLGPQGAGKTTYFKRYAKCAIEKGEGLIVPDFIKNCELADAIKEVTPPDRLIEIDLSNPKDLQGLGFNEVKLTKDMSDFEILEISNLQTQLVMALLNAVNDCGEPLSNKMRRYLSAACKICFIHPNRSLKNVVQVLEDYVIRHRYLALVPDGMNTFLDGEIRALKELDEFPKDSDPGTKSSKIEGILDRVNLLKEDIRLSYMFNKPTDDNIDFSKAMNQGKVILIRMPEHKFPTKQLKNVLVTFFISKIWIASQMRGADMDKPPRVHCIIDEVFQAPTTEFVLKDILVQARKYQLKFVFSCHYLNQLRITEALKASGSSYMIFQGSDKKNFNELKSELYPYEVDDLLNLKEYQSLNLIKGKKGYSAFITDLYDSKYDNKEKEPTC